MWLSGITRRYKFCYPVLPQKKTEVTGSSQRQSWPVTPVTPVTSKIINTQHENIKILKRYLFSIGETDTAVIDEYLNECASNPAIMRAELARITWQRGVI